MVEFIFCFRVYVNKNTSRYAPLFARISTRLLSLIFCTVAVRTLVITRKPRSVSVAGVGWLKACGQNQGLEPLGSGARGLGCCGAAAGVSSMPVMRSKMVVAHEAATA